MAQYDDKLLTIKQVSEILQVHEQTVRDYIREGVLPCIRLGRKAIRVSHEDLDSFLNSRRVASRHGSRQGG
jgi:excisionase family DNA binding protein